MDPRRGWKAGVPKGMEWGQWPPKGRGASELCGPRRHVFHPRLALRAFELGFWRVFPFSEPQLCVYSLAPMNPGTVPGTPKEEPLTLRGLGGMGKAFS